MSAHASRSSVFALALVVAVMLLAIFGFGNPPPAYGGCGTLSVNGKTFVFHKEGLRCRKARGLARLTYRTNKPPAGWRCPDASPGNNRRDGANCFKPGTGKSYGYHVAD